MVSFFLYFLGMFQVMVDGIDCFLLFDCHAARERACQIISLEGIKHNNTLFSSASLSDIDGETAVGIGFP